MTCWRNRLLGASLAIVCAFLLVRARPASAEPVERPDRIESAPKRLNGIDLEEHRDAELPLDVAFTDEQGRPATLRDTFDGSVPVILTLNYSDCPMLCSLELQGLVRGLRQLAWTPGKEFRVVTVSIDPKELPERARKTRARYLGGLGRAGADWRFLTGSEASIRAVTGAIGFKYAYNEARREYVHPAAIVVATPGGRIARYLYGIEYDARTLRLSLAEASQGKISTTVDRLLLFCFHYDETEGRYAPVARNIMKLGGAVSVALLGALLGVFWLGERRKKRLTELEHDKKLTELGT